MNKKRKAAWGGGGYFKKKKKKKEKNYKEKTTKSDRTARATRKDEEGRERMKQLTTETRGVRSK